MSTEAAADTTALVVSAAVVDRARRFFEQCGSRGFEGTALVAADIETARMRLVVPDQQPTRTRAGVSVMVTPTGQIQLASALAATERYVARIHSHPGEAFHSAADDRNPVLSFVGALSIVAPFYGLGLRHGLASCAVLRFDGVLWCDLPLGPARDRWIRAAIDHIEPGEVS